MIYYTVVPYPYQSLKLVGETERHWRFLCPFHKETEGSFTVNRTEPYKLWCKCWACGVSLSPKSFAHSYLQHDSKVVDSHIPACTDAVTILKERYKIDWKSKMPPAIGQIKGCSQAKVLADLVGVSPEAINKFYIGFSGCTGRYCIPMYDERGICGIQERWYSGDKCIKRCQRYSKHGWFIPHSIVYPVCEPIFITEGWSDTVVMVEMGFNVIGRFNALHVQRHPEFDDKPYIYIISDSDECGIKGSQKLQKLIGGKIIYTPTIYPRIWKPKDIRELYLKQRKEWTKQWILEQL
jgi:hypothetical protein